MVSALRFHCLRFGCFNNANMEMWNGSNGMVDFRRLKDVRICSVYRVCPV